MPESKSERLIRLVMELQAGPRTSLQIAKALNVSRRTAFRYLATLQEAGLPPHYQECAGFHLPGKTLVRQDATFIESVSLLAAVEETCRSVPFLEAARGMAVKVLSNDAIADRHKVTEASAMISIILPEPQAPESARKTFEALLDAMIQGQCVRIVFRGQSIRLSPYQLVYEGGHWFTVARSSFHRLIVTLNIADIDKWELLADRFHRPPRFQFRNYFKRRRKGICNDLSTPDAKRRESA